MSTNKVLTTIIVPIYNGTVYVRRVVEAVYAQDYGNIELILIDDGSQDDSYALIEELAKQAPAHITPVYWHQENAGICETRNRALSRMSGKYFLFLDQDDNIRPDYVSRLVQTAEQTDAELVIGGYDLVDASGRVLYQERLDPESIWSQYKINAPWGRLFRSDVAGRYNIRFMQTRISEDFYFNYLYMSYCRRVQVTSYAGYMWTYHDNSESHMNMKVYSEDRNVVTMMNELHKQMNPQHHMEQEYLEYVMIKHIIWYLLYVTKNADRKSLRKIVDDCFGWLETSYPDYIRNKLLRPGRLKGERWFNRMSVVVSIWLRRMHLFYPFIWCYARL